MNTNQPSPLITIKDLCFSRGERVIFKNVNLEVPEGKIVAIMGPSGTGKTTLLRLIGGQLKPNQGSIEIEGSNVAKLSRTQLQKLRRKMGFLFQQGGLFSDLNVFENVAFPLREHTKLSAEMIRDLVLLQLQAVGLRGAAKLRVEQLSGGMARRVAMARATILSPEIMLYDEPFTGQDPISRGVLLKLIEQLNQAFGLTSILVSHDILETTQVADYIYIIADGEIIGQGEPERIFNQASAKVEQFIQGLPDGPVKFHYPSKTLQEELNLC